MAIMRGVNSFLVTRYIVFALFTICNAITCSVAVWNYGLVDYSQPKQVDVYLIFLGAFSLLSIFTLIFVELLCANPLTTRVWFECAWVTLFWLMELAGGAALIAIESDTMCSTPTTTFLNELCTSERVLLAFTWMCSIVLLVYILVVVFLSASRYVEDSRIWVANIRVLGAPPVRHSSMSTPNSPLTARFKKRASVEIYAPRPVRSRPVPTYPYGISPEYEVEPFRPVFAAPEQMDIPHPPDLPEAIPLPPAPIMLSSLMKPIPPLPQEAWNSASLIQRDIQQEPVSSVEYLGPHRALGPGPVSGLNSLPSPLGDWPRQDIMQLPAKVKRKPPPPSAFEFPKKHLATMTSTDWASTPAETSTVAQPRPRRPSGPRERVPSGESMHRPAPLNLSGISNYETGRREDA